MKRQQRFMALFLAIVMLIATIPISAFARGEETVTFAGGDGSENNPYQVSTPEQLNAVRKDLSAYYIQINDIDMTDWGNWDSIGTIDNAFIGTYNGKGYVIKNLYVHTTSSGEEYVGLFGFSKGIIKNLGIVDCNISSIGTYGVSVGGIAGRNSDGKIENCYTSGSIYSEWDGTYSDSAGGIVGYNDGTIEECYNNGTVTAHCHAGGIVGSNNGIITNCYNVGTVSATDYNFRLSSAGGITGYNLGSIAGCYNIGSVSGKYSGGVVGINAEGAVNTNPTVSTCYYLNIISKGVGYGTDTATKCTEAQMKQQSTYMGFDFETVWTFESDSDYLYPVLKSIRNHSGEITPSGSSNQLYFVEPIVILGIGGNKTLNVHSRDVVNVNGELIYSNDKVVNASDIDWNAELYEDTGIIKINDNGQITALSEGYQHILINSKEDINQSAFCHVFVGDTNELHYTSTYDTKQYYADGGFYSEVSSISDCVELYILFENKLKEAVENISGIDEIISKDTENETFKDIKPITLTATVNGAGLSFDRETYQNTYTVTLETISLREAIDDILMLFPYNLNVASSGNNYTVKVTLESESFEAITDEYSFTVENLKTKSSNEHISFVSSDNDYKVSKSNIYGKTMSTLKNDAEYKWSKYSTLDFDNYYEVVLADMLVGLLGANQVELPSLVPKVLKDWTGTYKTLLGGITTIVNDDYSGEVTITELQIDKWLKESKYKTDGIYADDELYQTVQELLGNVGNAEKINKVFEKIDKTGKAFGFVKLGVNVFKDAVEWGNKISLFNTYASVNEEFKAVMQTFADSIPESEREMKEAVYDYINYSGDTNQQVGEILESFTGMLRNVSLDVFSSFVGKSITEYVVGVQVLNWIGTATVSGGVAFSTTAAFSGVQTAFGSFFTGATLGLCLSDVICDNSGKSAEMSKVVAMSEFAPYVINALNHYESKLYNDRNDNAVTYFEYAFAMHKATQSYIMQHTINSLEIKRDSLIIKLFGRDDYDGLISDILAYKKSVDNLECHNTNPASSVVTETKVIAIKCPVNVFVYDESGTEVVKIVNDNKEYVADGIYVFVEDGEKYIALPADQKYTVKIIATDSGTMEYTVTEYGAGAQRLRTIKKENIPLENNREFNGQVVAPMNVSPESYALTYDNKTVVANNIVNVPVIGVELNVGSVTMNIGETEKLSASVTPDNATNKGVTWSSDNPDVVKVDKDGNITALATGMATITVSSDDWGFIDTCTITVSCSHVQESEWSKDTEKHWHECPSCHNITDIDEHTFGDWVVIKDATDTEKGNKEKECAVCKYKVTEEIPVIKGEDTTSSNTNTDVSNNDSSDDVHNVAKPESSQANSPQTGDNNILIFWIAVLFVSGGVFVNLNVCSRKRKNN